MDHPFISPLALGDERDLGAAARQALRCHPGLPLPGAGRTLERWRTLARIAAADVCLAKVLEAHYDAQAILAELGMPAPDPGRLLAVWAAQAPGARLDWQPDGNGGGHLSGGKPWCSGASLVDAALVTAHEGERDRLLLVDLRQPGVTPREEGWAAVGMARIASGQVAFERVPAVAVGAPGDYLRRPGFWHGGAGVAACWYGAATAIAATLQGHAKVQRDPHAAAHLGAIDLSLQAAAALLRELAARIDAEPEQPHRDAVTRVRAFVERACSETIERVGRALGPAPLCGDRAHALRCADLAVFVRQSHAEHDWEALGRAVAQDQAPWRL